MAFNDETLPALKKEVDKELRSILSWWKQHAIDKKRGGFYGSVNNGNTPDATAPKGVVMTSRILWAFSAAYSHTNDPGDLLIATRAWEYLRDHFIGRANKFYWCWRNSCYDQRSYLAHAFQKRRAGCRKSRV